MTTRIRIVFLALASVVAASLAAYAAPFDTRGIPNEAQGIVFVDVAAIFKTQIGDAIVAGAKKRQQAKARESKSFENLQKSIGFHFPADLSSLTIGVIKPNDALNKEESNDSKGVIVFRGNFSPEKIIAFAKEKHCSVTQRNGATFVELSDEIKQELGGTWSPAKKIYLCIADAGAILLSSDEALIVKSLASLAGKTPPHELPAGLGTMTKPDSTPFVLATFTRDPLPAKLPPLPAKATSTDGDSSHNDEDDESGDAGHSASQMETLLLGISKEGDKISARIDTGYATTEAAQETQQTMMIMMAFAYVGATGEKDAEGKQTPKAQKAAKHFAQMEAGLNTEVKDKHFLVAWECQLSVFAEIVTEQLAQ